MSNRAEGCGQWLSSKRATTQLAPLLGATTKKKKKGLLNFATRSNRGENGGVNVQVSCSPLSPRARKKLQNAKQSKLDMFFKAEARPSGSTNDTTVTSEEKRIKIPLKRHRDDSSSFSEYGIETMQTNKLPVYSQDKEISETTDFNISGISDLGDFFHSSDECMENNLLQLELEPDKRRDSMDTHTLTPPNKKLRPYKSGSSLTESKRTVRNELLLAEAEPSQSFHFSQWKKDQIAKCREIQDEHFIRGSPCADTSSLINVEEESGLSSGHSSVGVEFSETPPFQFTQWANQQVEVCHRIQKETDSPGMVLHQSRNSGEQNNKPKLESRGKNSTEILNNHSDSHFDFSEWAENQAKLCRRNQETEDTSTVNWENENWDEWIYKTGRTGPMSLLSDESEFQFTEWVKSQVRKCRIISEDSEEGSSNFN